MITNKNMIFRKVNNDSRTTDKYLSLPEVATGSLTAVAADNEGGIVYDATTNTVKYSNGSAWANIATGGAAENAFATIDCPTGTDPVADSSSDTLVLKTADNTIVVTGTVASDQIDFKVGANLANANLAADAGIVLTKLAALARGSVIIGATASNVPTALVAKSSGYVLVGDSTDINSVEWTGDITLSTSGVSAIGSGVIVNTDVNNSAAIAYGKLNLTGAIVSGDLAGSVAVGKVALTTGSIILGTASVGAALDAKTDTAILIGDGATAAMQTISGDATMTNAGVLSVSDLTIASEAAGDILYFNGTNWIRLAKPISSDMYLEGGTTPVWSGVSAGIASTLAQSVNCEAGTNDYTLAFTTLTSGASTLTIPDMAGAAGTFAFINKAQTWTVNQTVEYGHLLLGDSNDGQTLQILVNEDMTGDKTLTYKPNDGDRIIDLSGNLVLGANVTTTGSGALTIASGASPRTITLAGALNISGNFQTIGDDELIFRTSAATDVTLPTTGTLATLAGTETLAAKTLTTPKIVTTGHIDDAGGNAYLTFVEDATPTDSIQITQGDSGLGATIEAITSETNADLLLDAAGTGDVTILDGTELTFRRSTQDALIEVTDQTGEDHTFTIPDIATGASDTFAFLAEAQTLTNKSIDADTNTITNVNATELDPVGNVAFGIPFVYRVDINADDGDVTVVSNSAFKFRVIDAWSVNTSGAGGVWSLKTDSGKCTDDVTVAANDTDVDRPTQFLDNMVDVAATTGDLFITVDASVVATVYINCLRID